jgi:hypothetical protein
MTKLYLPLLIALTLTSCSANTSADDNPVDTVRPTDSNQQKKVLANTLTDTLKVKQWLTNVIESYTNGEDPSTAHERMRNSLTDSYYNYKSDALSLDSDREPPMSKEEFKKKWEGKYNTKYVGFGAFIISAQDNGKIKVTSCNLLRGIERNASVYRVVIEDLDYKTRFNRDIKVIAQNGRLFVDDIMEYD